ncbi:MAG: tetratricopeptide repeat protein [Gemmataceae bacterium]|nr:tetratricopeptide repeat protein [Gemmataceae bacterium]MDW8265106.1 tetratricopeptide repeat protein [Gemmataceae bacterium]
MPNESALLASSVLQAARARLSLGQLWQVPTFFLGCIVLAAVAIAHPWSGYHGRRTVERDLATLRRDVRQPGVEVPQLLRQAEQLLGQVGAEPSRAAQAHFLLGALYVRLAEQAAPEAARAAWMKAREHLEQVEASELPVEDRPRLTYLLGKTWFHLDVDPGRVIAALSQAIPQGADDPAEDYGLLAQAYLRLPEPDVAAALEASRKQLAAPATDEALLAPRRLFQAKLLLRLGETDEARRMLQHLLKRATPNTSPATLGEARLLLARSYQEEGDWEEAIRLWEQVKDRADPLEAGRIHFELGLCYSRSNRPAEAARAWEQARQYGGPEGQAATLLLAEQRLRGPNPAAAVDYFARAVEHVAKPEDYQNPRVDLATARGLFERACRTFRDQGDYERALEMARLYERLAAPGAAQRLMAETAEVWAQALLARARQTKQPTDEQAARAKLRQAAAAWESAARAASTSAEQADWLMRAADQYFQAHEANRASLVLERLVAVPDLAPQRRGEAWLRLAEVHRVLKHDIAAQAALRKCLEYPGPAAYRARYQLALGELEAGRLDEAAGLLQQNLELMQAAPDLEAQEKSLYTLADVLFQRRDYARAIRYLERALELYPSHDGERRARFQLAMACRLHADQQLPAAADPSMPQAEHHFGRQRRKLLEQAASNFLKLVDDLGTLAATARLSPADEALFRQASFGLADCRYAQGQYDEAIRLYEVLAKRYEGQLDGLVALWHVWRCSWAKGDAVRMKQTHGRIEAALRTMDAAAFDAKDETRTRAWWEAWVEKNR